MPKGATPMKFSKTFTNKLVSFTDRYFTYDDKEMKREGTTDYFDFVGRDYGRHIYVYVHRNQTGMFVYIRKEGKTIIREILQTYKEIDTFKKMIRCLG
jgi:hypothetical protein